LGWWKLLLAGGAEEGTRGARRAGEGKAGLVDDAVMAAAASEKVVCRGFGEVGGEWKTFFTAKRTCLRGVAIEMWNTCYDTDQRM
jgi:hypothetical protein